MIVSIHQPNYLPYLGFFDKMMKSDVFVIYDDAQFNKEDFQHRNKIRIYHGWKWLTVPVDKKIISIKDINIKNELMTWKGVKWADSHLNEIRTNYLDSCFFRNYENELEKIYSRKFEKLIDLNMSLIQLLRKSFDINSKIIYSSDLVKSGKVSPVLRSSERLIKIVEAVGGDIYLSGKAGRDYLDFPLFKEREIKVEIQDYKHPEYKQCYDGFIPNMAALDALFNVGEMPK